MIMQPRRRSLFDDAPVVLTLWMVQSAIRLHFIVVNQDAVNDSGESRGRWRGCLLTAHCAVFSPASLCENALDVACSSVERILTIPRPVTCRLRQLFYTGINLADGNGDASCSGIPTLQSVFTTTVTSPCDMTSHHKSVRHGIAKGITSASAVQAGLGRTFGAAGIDDCVGNPCGGNSVCTNELSALELGHGS